MEKQTQSGGIRIDPSIGPTTIKAHSGLVLSQVEGLTVIKPDDIF
jgi:hypothetical protein